MRGFTFSRKSEVTRHHSAGKGVARNSINPRAGRHLTNPTGALFLVQDARQRFFGGAKVGPACARSAQVSNRTSFPTGRGRTASVVLTTAHRSYYNAATIRETSHTNQ